MKNTDPLPNEFDDLFLGKFLEKIISNQKIEKYSCKIINCFFRILIAAAAIMMNMVVICLVIWIHLLHMKRWIRYRPYHTKQNFFCSYWPTTHTPIPTDKIIGTNPNVNQNISGKTFGNSSFFPVKNSVFFNAEKLSRI